MSVFGSLQRFGDDPRWHAEWGESKEDAERFAQAELARLMESGKHA